MRRQQQRRRRRQRRRRGRRRRAPQGSPKEGGPSAPFEAPTRAPPPAAATGQPAPLHAAPTQCRRAAGDQLSAALTCKCMHVICSLTGCARFVGRHTTAKFVWPCQVPILTVGRAVVFLPALPLNARLSSPALPMLATLGLPRIQGRPRCHPQKLGFFCTCCAPRACVMMRGATIVSNEVWRDKGSRSGRRANAAPHAARSMQSVRADGSGRACDAADVPQLHKASRKSCMWRLRSALTRFARPGSGEGCGLMTVTVQTQVSRTKPIK
jgi:hypothetical protein